MPENKPNLFDIRRYSEDLQIVMTTPPKWIIKWGLTVILLVLLSILFASYIIKYPEIINANFTLSSYTPSLILSNKEAGRIQFLCKENDTVQMEQHLAYINNTGSLQNVLDVENTVSNVKNQILLNKGIVFSFQEELVLGELQESYTRLAIAIEGYKFALKNNGVPFSKEVVSKQKNKVNELISIYGKQYDIAKKQLELNKAKLGRDSILLSKGIVSTQEFENTKINYLSSKNVLQNIEQSINQSDYRIIDLENKNFELSQQETKTFFEFKNSVVSLCVDLENRIRFWKDKYLIKAPIDGVVSFFEFRNNNEFIIPGKSIFAVKPLGNQQSVGICNLQFSKSGKVKVGQKVTIDFANFPANEYGFVTGKVKSISTLPKENSYITYIELDEGLKTDQGRVLEYKEQMSGTAKIFTKDIRLIERFFYSFKKLVDRK